MKTLLALFALLCVLPLRAEDPLDFFPHHIGDTWFYGKDKLTIVKDSTGDDGSVWLWYNDKPTPLYKVDAQYYTYSINPYWRKYKLDAKTGDVWTVLPYKDSDNLRIEAWLVKEYKAFVLGKLTTVKEIAYFTLLPKDTVISNHAVYMYTEYLAGGIGPYMEIGEAGGIEYEVTGCIIDGEKFGVTAVHEVEEPKPIFLSNWPNPCRSQTILRFSALSLAHVEIIDILGTTVFSVPQENTRNGENSYSVNTSAWKPGIYFCRLTTGRQTVMRKIIVY